MKNHLSGHSTAFITKNVYFNIDTITAIHIGTPTAFLFSELIAI